MTEKKGTLPSPAGAEAVPVAYQQRELKRGEWSDWYPSNKEAYDEQQGAPRPEYEVRALIPVGSALVAPASLPDGWGGPACRQLERITFAVQHNPNCPSPWLVRLPGSGLIDLKHYGDPLGLTKSETGDILGFGKTFEEAASAALAARPATLASEDPAPIPADVYYSLEADNFYSISHRRGMGREFYAKWRDRRKEFPAAPANAKGGE